MRSKKILIAAISLALVFCACGGSEDSCGPCNTPPADRCMDENTLEKYWDDGVCLNGHHCLYEAREQHCEFGCQDGACQTDPCASTTCDSPPGPCYLSTGTCVTDPDVHCEYAQLPDGAACDDGVACTLDDACLAGVCTPGSDNCGLEIVVLIYNAADNDLDEYMADDFLAMQAGNLDNYDFIRLFVLYDRASGAPWTDTRLYEVHNGSAQELDGPNLGLTVAGTEELNMGDPAVLNNFILDVEALVGTTPDFYLIMADHGDGWWRRLGPTGKKPPPTLGCCYDETSGDDYLESKEIHQGIAGMGLTLLGFDACLEGMAEVAYEHRDDAQLMIASPEMEGAWGWDWTQVFTQFGQSADHSALNFVRIVVDTYMALSLSELDEYATLAVYDLSRMDELATAATDMAAAITPLSDTDFYAICDTLDWYGCDGPDCEDYVDLTQLATQAAVVDPTNASTYNAVSAAVAQAVIYEAHATAHPDSHGMNVYFPCYYYPWDEYADVTWAIDTGWGPMVLAH